MEYCRIGTLVLAIRQCAACVNRRKGEDTEDEDPYKSVKQDTPNRFDAQKAFSSDNVQPELQR